MWGSPQWPDPNDAPGPLHRRSRDVRGTCGVPHVQRRCRPTNHSEVPRSPVVMTGVTRFGSIVLRSNDRGQVVADPLRVRDMPGHEENLVLRAIGHRSSAVPGPPFDEDRCVIPRDLTRQWPSLLPISTRASCRAVRWHPLVKRTSSRHRTDQRRSALRAGMPSTDVSVSAVRQLIGPGSSSPHVLTCLPAVALRDERSLDLVFTRSSECRVRFCRDAEMIDQDCALRPRAARSSAIRPC